MELFPAQPDLSLQISPPNSKPTSDWRGGGGGGGGGVNTGEVDLGLWKRGLESRSCFLSSMPKTDHNHTHLFHLSHSNPTTRTVTPSSSDTDITSTTLQSLHHHHFQNSPFHQHLGFLRPIRGIPLYQHPPGPHPHAPPAVGLEASSVSVSPASARSRFLSHRFPAKRSMRAPRMRWTSSLHARFVHAVDLLGGHESI